MVRSYSITEARYNYLLPIFGLAGMLGSKMLRRITPHGPKFYFIGTRDEHLDMLNRCKYMN